MNGDLGLCLWPLARLCDALSTLALRSGFTSQHVDIQIRPPDPWRADNDAVGGWIEQVASLRGIEAVQTQVRYGEIGKFIQKGGPAILSVPDDNELQLLVLLSGTSHSVSLLGRDGMVHRVKPELVRSVLCCDVESSIAPEVDHLLKETGIPPRRQEQARTVILRQQLNHVRIEHCWLLRLPPHASFWRQIQNAHLPRYLFAFTCAHTIQYALWIVSWWVLGMGALQGHLDKGWLLTWFLLLLSMVPFRLLVTWSQGFFTIGLGALLKQRLLYGSMGLASEEIRHQGSGQLLGRVIESEAVESLALSGGLLALMAGVELAVSMVILNLGAGGLLHSLLLMGWTGFTILLGWQYMWHRHRWTKSRLEMTHDLTESMVGYRTRLAQEIAKRWHVCEDKAIERSLELSKVMDRSGARLVTLAPRGWVILSLIGLIPAVISSSSSATSLAVGLGGTLLAYRALRRLAPGLWNLAAARIAWQQVAPFFRAAAHSETTSMPIFAHNPNPANLPEMRYMLEAQSLVFRYIDRKDPILSGCNLHISHGDRLLLEGSSGSGKSTLAALLAGLRLPESGLLLLHGLDYQTLGKIGWRRQVAMVPQFHENYVFNETFAFNLLMGRRWPPRPEDLAEATAICREIGLGDLVDRMPGGLLQMVGETGWQLSHGERSRLYVARALLQKADLVVIDESFAALDPQTLQQTIDCVFARASTLLVIAHP